MRFLIVILFLSMYLVGCASSTPFKYQHPRPIPDVSSHENLNCQFLIENKIGPKYPHEAMMKYQEGWAVISGTLYQGRIANLHVIDSSPKGVFEEPSKDALEEWDFILSVESKNKMSCKTMKLKQLFVFSMKNESRI